MPTLALDELNDEQRAAAEAALGPALIVAGPGTGKTKTLTARISYLIESGQARPEEILALTFTKKAAEEMRVRQQNKRVHIGTFHAICHEIIGGEQEFVSEAARLQIIKKLARPPELKGFSARELGLRISRAKNMADKDPKLTELVKLYNEALQEQQLRDFDDLLLQAREVLQQNEAVREAIQQKYRHILVDEFQDTNRLQYELLRLMRNHDNIFVIGDPNQSIYGFRGASGDIFTQFKEDFPRALAITLTINYRSAPEIVRLSNHVFVNSPPLAAHTPASGNVRALQVLNEYREAAWVVGEIQRSIGGGDMLRAVSDDDRTTQHCLRDFAILYRNRSAAIAAQRAVDESGLPYQIVGEGSPYEQPQVQALMALLRAAATGEEPTLEGFSDAEIRAVRDILAPHVGAAPSKLADRLMGILGFERTAGMHQFSNTLVRFATLPDAVNYFDRLQETQFYDTQADVITLLTIHAAKGLEFPHVFLVAAEEGILPHARADVEEERRLFYVAITRARETLDIMHVKNRAGRPAELSRFVREIDASVLPKTIDPNLVDDARRAQMRAIKRSQQALF